tara:strand:- start:320 stop:1747 length:1428 start_codon:yes stop_codon:yes gene_type:complete
MLRTVAARKGAAPNGRWVSADLAIEADEAVPTPAKKPVEAAAKRPGKEVAASKPPAAAAEPAVVAEPASATGSGSIAAASSARSGSLSAEGSLSAPAVKDIVQACLSGKVDVHQPSASMIGLPSSAAELEAAGGLDAVLKDCIGLMRADYPLLALRRLLTLADKLDLPMRELLADPHGAEILQVASEMNATLEAIVDDSWQLYTIKKQYDCHIYTKPAGGGRLDVKCTGVLPRRMTSCLAPLLHPELYKTWVPLVAQSSSVADPSPFRKLVYVRARTFPGLTTRDVVLLGYGDLVASDSVMVYLCSLHDGVAWDGEGDPPEEALPGGSYAHLTRETDEMSNREKNIRLRVLGGFVVTAEGKETTRIECFAKVDVRHPLVPGWIIDFIMKNLASVFLTVLSAQAAKYEPGGKLHGLLSAPENTHTYSELHRRLADEVISQRTEAGAVAHELHRLSAKLKQAEGLAGPVEPPPTQQS